MAGSTINIAEFCTQEEEKFHAHDRVLSVTRVDGGLEFEEMCDQWFSLTLTDEQVREFCARMLAMLEETP